MKNKIQQPSFKIFINLLSPFHYRMLRRAVGFQTSTSTEDDPDPTSDGKTANNDMDEDDEDNSPNSAYPSLPSELDNELLDASKCRIYFRCLAKLLISCSNKQKSFLGAHPGNLREAIKQMTVDVDAAFGETGVDFLRAAKWRKFRVL